MLYVIHTFLTSMFSGTHIIQQAYFPVVTAPQGGPVEFQDTDGKEWVFKFRYWPCSSSRTYVLEGLRDYMSAMKGQVGDMGKI